MRRILVQRRMSVNAVTRVFTAAHNDRSFPLEFRRRILSSLKVIRSVVLAWWAQCVTRSRTYCRQTRSNPIHFGLSVIQANYYSAAPTPRANREAARHRRTKLCERLPVGKWEIAPATLQNSSERDWH